MAISIVRMSSLNGHLSQAGQVNAGLDSHLWPTVNTCSKDGQH